MFPRTSIVEIDGVWYLKLYDKGLPRAMSTHEARTFVHDQAFGRVIQDLNKIADSEKIPTAREVRNIAQELSLE